MRPAPGRAPGLDVEPERARTRRPSAPAVRNQSEAPFVTAGHVLLTPHVAGVALVLVREYSCELEQREEL